MPPPARVGSDRFFSSTMKGFLLLLSGGLASVAVAASSEQAARSAIPSDEELAKAEVKAAPVAGGVFMLQGLGGNIGAFPTDDGLLVIDSEYGGLSTKIQAALQKLSPQRPRFLVNTHWHPDHTDGNAAMGRLGVTIVAHENVRKRLSVEQYLPILKANSPALPPIALPVVTFDQELELHLAGEQIRLLHVPPAHTDGDAIVHFIQADVIHAGDLFLNKAYPIVDYDSGGTLDGLLRAQEKIVWLAGPKTKIIPGHGPLGDREALQDVHDKLLKVRNRIAAMVDAGKSLADVQAARPAADVDAEWGKGFMKEESFVDMAYKAYVAQRRSR
jgi:glyoxylase-like metal-dependent hydrolase (beta-lactamase superfamily II)